MAEAAVEHAAPAARFFCHLCAQEVSPVLPEYTCSRCHSGFIEELTQPAVENPSPREDDIDARAFEQLTDRERQELQVFFQSFPPEFGTPRGQGRVTFSRPPTSRRQFRADQRNRLPQEQYLDPRNPAGGFLQHFIQSLTGGAGFTPNANFPVFVNLPGNPGDYVWGRGGWNAIISQLINQLDGTGPPPLSREKIDEIPVVQIIKSHIDQNLQCTVCMEDFVLDEPVRLLPCQHHYHENCIIPWLQLHGTCPICRKLLTNESAQFTNDSSGAGPSSDMPGASSTAAGASSRPAASTNPNVPSSQNDMSSLFSDSSHSLYDYDERNFDDNNWD